MGILRTNTLSGIGTDGPVFDGVTRLDTFGYVVPPVGVTSDRTLVGVTTAQGSIRFNTDSQKLEFYAQDQWWEMVIDTPALAVGSNTGAGARGLIGGGYVSPAAVNTINYINISSAGNAIDFGDLFTGRYGFSLSSATRGLWAGYADNIEYVTISSTGNAQDFGDLTTRANYNNMNQGCSNSTRGLWSGGGTPGARTNIIDYVTIAATGNAVDFGDLTRLLGRAGAVASPTRGIFIGGSPTTNPSISNVIDFVTIATTGNAVDFGDLTSANQYGAGCSSNVRGLYGGGGNPSNTNIIDYITIATLGNAVKFGELTIARATLSSCSSSTRGVWAGGPFGGGNTIDYVTISTQGNAVDFGDLLQSVWTCGACSNAHGGL